jgi:RNA polymerase sporulation-specific sigma factor
MEESSVAVKSKYDENPDLIERYREGDREAGERLVVLNAPLVCSIAGRFTGRGVEMEDLVALGNLGLLKAVGSFDRGRGCAFSTYAVPLIFVEIRRFLRDDGPIKVSREEKRLLARISREREERLMRGEDVSVKSLAKALSVSTEEVASALGSGAPIRSFEESASPEDSSLTLGSVIFDEDEGRRSFERLCLSSAIEALDPWQRKLIILRYFKDLSQTETAGILGVTQVKVSREEKKILKALGKALA